MGVLITYDVSKEHVELKKRMIALGYSKLVTVRIADKAATYNLPNTTLWRAETESYTAVADLKKCASGLVAIERVVAVKIDKISGEVGIPL